MPAVTIGVIADIHANLPALEAALAYLDQANCEEILCIGDFVAIGPHPAECFDLLCERGVTLLRGNHEDCAILGLTPETRAGMSESEQAHQAWTHARLGEERRRALPELPRGLRRRWGAFDVYIAHYAISDGHFAAPLRDASAEALDGLFADVDADVVLFGHDHTPCDRAGARRSINPGALGCSRDGLARGAVLRFGDEAFDARFFAIPYDREKTLRAFEERDVAGREEILSIFFNEL